MSTLFRSYSSFLNSVYNYPKNMETNHLIFNNFYTNFNNFVDYNFTSNLNRYPIYGYKNQIINDMTIYDIGKIHNISADGTNYLIDAIDKHHILSQKNVLDKIPIIRSEFIKDYSQQFTYFSKIEDLYDQTLFFNLKSIKPYNNFPELLFNEPFDTKLNNGSFLQYFTLQILFRQIYFNSNNFLSKSIIYFTDNDIINNDNIIDEFDLFINIEHEVITNEIVDVILKNVYQFPAVTKSIKDKMTLDITPNVLEIKQIFKDFVNDEIKDPVLDMSQIFNDSLANIFAVKTTTDIYKNDLYFNQNTISSLVDVENKIIEDYKNELSPINIQQYLYLLFFYKFWPFKFINIIPYIVNNYVENFLKKDTDVCIDIFDLNLNIQNIINSLNSNELINYLDENNTNSYFITLKNQNQNSKFTMFLYFTQKLDLFIETDQFIKYIENIVNKIYKSLSSSTHVEYKFNWFKNHKVLHAYFKTLFRKHITSNTIFNNIYTLFDNEITKIIGNTTGDEKCDTQILYEKEEIETANQNLINYDNQIYTFFENHVTSTLMSEISFEYISYFLLDKSLIEDGGIGNWTIDDYIIK